MRGKRVTSVWDKCVCEVGAPRDRCCLDLFYCILLLRNRQKDNCFRFDLSSVSKGKLTILTQWGPRCFDYCIISIYCIEFITGFIPILQVYTGCLSICRSHYWQWWFLFWDVMKVVILFLQWCWSRSNAAAQWMSGGTVCYCLQIWIDKIYCNKVSTAGNSILRYCNKRSVHLSWI